MPLSIKPIILLVVLINTPVSDAATRSVNDITSGDLQFVINGYVEQGTCTVNVLPSDTITLPVVLLSDVKNNINEPVGDTSFTLHLTNCPISATRANIIFSGEVYNNIIDYSVLKPLQSPEAAQGIGVSIMDGDRKGIDLFNKNRKPNAEIPLTKVGDTTEGSATFFTGYRLMEKDKASPGTISADLEYDYIVD